MRSMTALCTHKRTGRTRRAAIAARASARPMPRSTTRSQRRVSRQCVATAHARINQTERRTLLGRVRPLRVIPRGVVPYVKH